MVSEMAEMTVGMSAVDWAGRMGERRGREKGWKRAEWRAYPREQ